MFGQTQPTEFDLRFRLFGIPIRVHPFFFLGTAIMGWGSMEHGPQHLVLWVAICFISILVHELGHALVSRWLGCYGQAIDLYGMGGLAHFQPGRGYTHGKSILISLAGPGAGFLLYALMRFVLSGPLERWANGQGNPAVAFLVSNGVYQWEHVNLWWGLINLLPVHPLDGGQVCMSVCKSLSRYRGDEYCHKIGMVVGGLVAAWFFQAEQTYAAILFAMLAMGNYDAIQRRNHF